ncbi:4-hydroxy-tetrahydrodipicolinate synthase [Bradyrhizobium canariense]|uniref:4-hydroxy-tetrahydrodipicolinate synthase n=1 Tax=Bradyrhizobium canariense TaxID=255045 RepID=A0A1H2AM28_9BRAD|nr:4-hydroxy-tetrahydrodipicolinate synthase [Bradyrhizobium canariense]SDT46904.1 4-hydroxy-tetrahydrodipicolinate synthase [Bradyrhizobium canariense]
MARIYPSHWLGGFIADLPTPFDDHDGIDWPAFEMLCEHQIGSGATAIVVNETMGEASTLSEDEHGAIIGTAVKVARGRIAVIAGAGSNSTSQAIELTARAEAEGAYAVLSVVPYYNKPMQAGILAHFQNIAASTSLPIILHDNPSRTMREMSDETILRLSESSQFLGLNDATGNVARLFRLRSMLPAEFRLLCGNDVNAAAYLACGGDGCISMVANLFPDLCRRSYDSCMTGNVRVSRDLSGRLAAFGALLSADSSVAALKYGMSMLGFMGPAVRLPLVELDDDAKQAITLPIAAALGENQIDKSSARPPAHRRSNAR